MPRTSYPPVVSEPSGVLSRQLLPASIAIFTTVALVAFEGLAVAAALPELAADLGGVGLLPWTITGFLLTSGIATAISGPLVDGVGTRTMFRWAVGIFVSASVAAALAPTMQLMVAARIVQGAGGGMISAVGIAAVGLVYPRHLVGRAFAANATVWGVMSVAAPAIAALMLTVLNWRWIFLVNLPLGLAALLAGWRVLPGPAGRRDGRVDWLGATMVGTVTIGMAIAVDRLDWSSLAWLAAVAIAASLYVRHAGHHEAPIVRLEHLIRQPYSGLALGIGLMVAGAIAAETYIPLYVRGALGAGPALTAWSVLFFTLGWTTGANVSGRLIGRMSESSLTVGGFGITIPALVTLWGVVTFDLPAAFVFVCLYLAGTGVGTSTNSGLTLLRTATPDDQLGRVTAAHQVARAQGFTIGAALGGSVILLAVARAVPDLDTVRRLLAGESADITSAAAQGIADGFGLTALVGAGVVLAGLPAILRLRKYLAPARAEKRANS
jgi:MFS family permease